MFIHKLENSPEVKRDDLVSDCVEHITLGALGDSFYEYLLKLWILKGKPNNSEYRRMYDSAMDNVYTHLVKKSTPNQLTYIAEMIGGRIDPKMDHLVCFAGAMFALGSFDSPNPERDMLVGSGTCWCKIGITVIQS